MLAQAIFSLFSAFFVLKILLIVTFMQLKISLAHDVY